MLVLVLLCCSARHTEQDMTLEEKRPVGTSSEAWFACTAGQFIARVEIVRTDDRQFGSMCFYCIYDGLANLERNLTLLTCISTTVNQRPSQVGFSKL
jgi:hypothetical protein